MNIFQYIAQLQILENPKILLPLLFWIILWKGLALWKAAQKQERVWFWLLMCINTLGILEICYIFVFSHPNNDLRSWKEKLMSGIKGKKVLNKKEEITVEPIEENTNNQE